MKIMLFLIVVLLLNAVLNIFRLVATYNYYWKFKGKDPRLSEYATAVDRLFDKAETNQVFVSTRFAGKSITYCLGMNDYRDELDETFKRTIGVYKFRFRNTFNPFYWLELPKRILKRNKWDSKPFAVSLFPAFFWLVNIVAAYFIEKVLDVLFQGLPSILESILR